MPFLAGQFLSVLTFFVTVKAMVSTWWNPRSAPDDALPPPSPTESTIRNNAGSPVQLDKLSIRSFGVDFQDISHVKLHDQTKNALDHSLLRTSDKEDSKFNVFNLLFVKSSTGDNFLVEDPVQNHMEDINEARVNAVGATEGLSRVQQENDKDKKRESLPVKTESESSVSTTASCRVAWVPWRVWIEHMRNAEITFHWVNPFRRLRKKIKNKTTPKASTGGNEGQTKNREEPAVIPGPSATDKGEVVINPGPSTTDHEEPADNPGSCSDRVNTGCVRATLAESWCNYIRYHLQWRFPFNRSRANSYTIEQPAEVPGQTNMHGTHDKTTREVDRNGKTHSDKQDDTAVVSSSHNASINDAWMKVMDRDGSNTTKRGNNASEKESAWTNDSSSMQTSSVPSTSVTSKSQNIDVSRASTTSKVDGIKNAHNQSGIPQNRTTVCAFVRNVKNAKFSWNNPFKRTVPTDKNDIAQTGSTEDQVIPGSLENDRNQNFRETPVIACNNVIVTPHGIRSEGVTQDGCDIPGTSTETAAPANNQVDAIQNAKNTTAIPQNRTTVCAFVRSFKNAKFSWNNPFKRTVPTDKDDIERTRSTDDQVISGSPENDTNQNFQETPVVPIVTPVQMYKPAGQPVRAWGMDTNTGTTTGNRVYGLKTHNSYTPASLFLASSQPRPSLTIPSSSRGPSTNCGVLPEVPSNGNSNKKKKTLSFFQSKSKHEREGPKQRRFSKHRNVIRPL